MSNWEKQIEDHVREGVLSYCVYYGTGRSMTPEQLKQYDVVITTYQTVAREHGDLGKNGSNGPTQKKQKTEKRSRGHRKVKTRVDGAFEQELGQRAQREGVRAKKGDAIGGMGKKRSGEKK